jgi:hypothetical protein
MYFSLFPFVRLLLSSKKKSMMIKIQIGFKKKNLVGPAGFEPTTFTQEPREAVPYGFL